MSPHPCPSPRRWEGSEVSGFPPSGAPLPSQGRGRGGLSPSVRRSPPFSGEGQGWAFSFRQALPSLLRGGAGVGFLFPFGRSLPIWGRVREGLPFRSGGFEILITDGCGFLRPLRGTSEQVEFKFPTTKKASSDWRRLGKGFIPSPLFILSLHSSLPLVGEGEGVGWVREGCYCCLSEIICMIFCSISSQSSGLSCRSAFVASRP